MKRTILRILLAALLLSACGPAVAQINPTAQNTVPPVATKTSEAVTPAPVSAGKPGDAVITFHRSGGFAGVDETWTIYADGRVVDPKGGEQNIDAAQLSTLLGDIEALGFFGLKDSYGKFSQCNDCFTYTLTVNSGGKSKSITFRDGATGAPPELSQVLEKINTLINKPK